MARRQTRVGISEIEALRRRLGEVASTETGLPDGILRKFERLLTIAHDPSCADEAVRLATELYQFHNPQRGRGRPPKIEPRPVVRVLVPLEPALLAALDEFMAMHKEADSRTKAVRMVLEGALNGSGSSPKEERIRKIGCRQNQPDRSG